MTATPPKALRRPRTETRHGDVRTDDYAWLRDDNWQQVMRDPQVLDADIRAYLEAENAYANAVLAPLSDEIERLFQEMKGRIKQDDSSVPLPDGPWAYYHRYRDGGEHPLFCRRPRVGGGETLMFDGDAAAEGQAYFKLAACEHSPDHRYLAYAIDLNGSEIFTLKVRDLETAQIAVQASLTGHLVMTTLHTNDAPSSIIRLVDLGLEPFLLTATIEGIVAQRLVRKLDMSMREEYVPAEEELLELNLRPSDVKGRTFFRPGPKAKGVGGGYKGRMALFEIMTMDDQMRDLVMKEASTSVLRDHARKRGMRSLRECGLLSIYEGHTSIDEVMRETLDDE